MIDVWIVLVLIGLFTLAWKNMRPVKSFNVSLTFYEHEPGEDVGELDEYRRPPRSVFEDSDPPKELCEERPPKDVRKRG